MSYLKTCAAEGQSAHAADFTEDSETGATYQKAEGTFLFGYAEEDEVSRGEADARRRCDELGDACTGYTCAASIQVSPSMTKKGYAEAQQAQSCTVRSGRELIRSPSNELTYLKVSPSATQFFSGTLFPLFVALKLSSPKRVPFLFQGH